MTTTATFPDDFVFGAATSAYQIEGAPLEEGAGVSNWHRFTRIPGKVANGDTGDIACDHYRRMEGDVEMMQTIGLDAYRFSVAWSRILPEGRGKMNPKGVDFYHRLLDALERAGIAPYLTLHHWDLPQALDELGGWSNRDCAYWFADYAHLMFKAFGPRVRHWTTHNEPWVMVHEGYVAGSHPPGLQDLAKAHLASHHLLLGHGLAVQAFRADGSGEIGLVVNLEPKDPASQDPHDLDATHRMDAWMNRQFLDPLFGMGEPPALATLAGWADVRFPADDDRIIQTPMDFLGINYYSRQVVTADPTNLPFGSQRLRQSQAEHTDMDWEVYPQGIKRCLLWVRQRYGDLPLYVTENGAALPDPAPVNGRVHDPRRIAYFKSHLLAIREAMDEGVNLKGYFAWSLFDNFEWAFGYGKRFGLIYVDYKTLERTLKDSARFYRELIGNRGFSL